MKIFVAVEVGETSCAKDIGVDELFDGLWVVGVKTWDEATWRSLSEELVNEFSCDVVVELPEGDVESLSTTADLVCKWQPKLIPHFPMTMSGLIACKRFARSGMRVALSVKSIGQLPIASKASPTLLKMPALAISEACDDELSDVAEVGLMMRQSFERFGYTANLLLEVNKLDDLNIAFVASPDGILLPLSLLRGMTSI